MPIGNLGIKMPAWAGIRTTATGIMLWLPLELSGPDVSQQAHISSYTHTYQATTLSLSFFSHLLLKEA